MRYLLIFIISVMLASCDMSLMSQSERTAIAELACAELRATDADQSLQRLRIVNTVREKLAMDPYLGEDDDIKRYLRWETCEQFIVNTESFLSETNRRERAYSIIKNAAEASVGAVRSEYFAGDLYLVSSGRDDTLFSGAEVVLINTQTMSPYSGVVKGIRRVESSDGEEERFRTERNYSDGEENGLNRDWYLNGQLEAEFSAVDGRRQGLYRSWHDNGQRKRELTYEAGLRQGVQKSWDENGQLISEATFSDDKLERFRAWMDGKLGMENNYVNGEKHGVQRVWHQDGETLMVEANFRKGELHGVGRKWDENGNLSFEENYHEGELHGVQKTWDKNGNLTREETYINGVVL